jgi:hypothetical protein
MQFLVIIYTRNEKNGCISSDVLRILLNVNGRVKEYKIFTDKARQQVKRIKTVVNLDESCPRQLSLGAV